MAVAPPVIKIGPPPASGKKNDLDRFIAKNGLTQYKTAIQQWAGEFGVPALWVAATIKFEGGTPGQLNKAGRGFGIAQIDPKTWFGKVFPPTGETINAQWASQPSNAIAFTSWLLSRSTAGDLAGAYKQVYNPGYTGQKNDPKGLGPASLLGGYKVTVTGTTPTQKAAGAAATSQANAANLADASVKARQFLDPIYMAYTGRRATPAEIQNWVRDPVSQYQIQSTLSDPKQNPRIYVSPIWQTNSARYDAYYRQIYGDNAAPPKQVLLHAIVHNLDQAAFQDELIHGKVPGAPDYTTSEQYKGNLADATKVYANIYGQPDQPGQTFLKSAVLGGWNQSQIEAYLRAQPEYTSSAEYKQRAIDLASRMGLVQGSGGAQTALQAPQAVAAANG